MKNKIFIVLLVLFLGHLFYRIYSYKDDYLKQYDPSYWRQRYLNSQWVGQSGCDWDPHINPVTCVWDDAWFAAHPVNNYKFQERELIGDDGLYAYAGWEYINGKDPTLLNAEMPPLGKYLIGLSIALFKNQNIFALFTAISALWAYFLLNKLIFKSALYAFIPVVLFSFEKLFYTQIRAPFLDLLYLTFLLFSMFFFLKKKYIFSCIFLGCMMATKATLATFLLVLVVFLAYLLIQKNLHRIPKLIIISSISFVVFALTYSIYFLSGHGVIGFLKVQKWVFNFYTTGAKSDYGIVYPMLFQGSWNTWWGTTEKLTEWSITWPVLLMLFFGGIILYFKKGKQEIIQFLFIWTIVYISFLSFIPVWPRYLLLLLPFLYTSATWTIIHMFPYLKTART